MDQITLKNISPEVYRLLNDELGEISFDSRIELKNPKETKENIVLLSRLYNRACILNNNYPNIHSQTGFTAALGCKSEIIVDEEYGAFDSIQNFYESNKGQWIFGFLAYDLKNDVEDLKSEKDDDINFPNSHFFVPEVLLHVNGNYLYVKGKNSDELLRNLEEFVVDEQRLNVTLSPEFNSRPGKDEYIKAVNELIGEIRLGNIYEINFCRQLSCKQVIDPYYTSISLSRMSPAPFTCFYKFDDKFLICASPERFLLKSSEQLISQPIKGTRKRSSDPMEDAELKAQLSQDVKERAENVMIVDLVRNDLSHTAKRGSVVVMPLSDGLILTGWE